MYDYLKEMTGDVMEYITDNYTPEDYMPENSDIKEVLNDELWAEDSITGNGANGKYFDSAAEAQQAAFQNVDLLIEAIEEFGNEPEQYKKAMKDPHFADSTIRCYMLSNAIYNALKELREA